MEFFVLGLFLIIGGVIAYLALYTGKGLGIGLGVVGTICLIASFVRLVQPGNVGVVIVFGRVDDRVVHNGVHLINPFATLEKMSIRTEEYTMSKTTSEGEVEGDDAIAALTSEGLSVDLDVTVWYHLVDEKAPQVYKNLGLGYIHKIIRPAVRTSIRNIIANYKVQDIYTKNREMVSSQIADDLSKSIIGRGIEVEQVLLRDIKLPKKVQDEIDAKMAAKQEAEKMEFILQKEKQEVDRKVLEARGISDANRIIAKSLSQSYLQWYYIQTLQKLIGSPNNTIVITPFDQKLTPLLNVK